MRDYNENNILTLQGQVSIAQLVPKLGTLFKPLKHTKRTLIFISQTKFYLFMCVDPANIWQFPLRW